MFLEWFRVNDIDEEVLELLYDEFEANLDGGKFIPLPEVGAADILTKTKNRQINEIRKEPKEEYRRGRVTLDETPSRYQRLRLMSPPPAPKNVEHLNEIL